VTDFRQQVLILGAHSGGTAFGFPHQPHSGFTPDFLVHPHSILLEKTVGPQKV
jgi:hypothetical protein